VSAATPAAIESESFVTVERISNEVPERDIAKMFS